MTDAKRYDITIDDRYKTSKNKVTILSNSAVMPGYIEKSDASLPAGCSQCQSTFPCEETCGINK